MAPTDAAEAERDQDEPTSVPPPDPSKPDRTRIPFVVEILAVVAIAVAIFFIARTFVIQTFYIPSASMEPTLMIGDRIVVSKLSYDFHSVERGDIIVFARPPAENCGGPPVADLVKRVIGLPGNRLYSKGNTVYVNGKPLAEPWLPKNDPLGQPIAPTTVPANDYFVMGDNRDDSCDSRDWGPVPQKLIVGKVEMTFWPLSHFKFF